MGEGEVWQNPSIGSFVANISVNKYCGTHSDLRSNCYSKSLPWKCGRLSCTIFWRSVMWFQTEVHLLRNAWSAENLRWENSAWRSDNEIASHCGCAVRNWSCADLPRKSRRAVVENVRFYWLKLQIGFSEALYGSLRTDLRLNEALQSLQIESRHLLDHCRRVDLLRDLHHHPTFVFCLLRTGGNGYIYISMGIYIGPRIFGWNSCVFSRFWEILSNFWPKMPGYNLYIDIYIPITPCNWIRLGSIEIELIGRLRFIFSSVRSKSSTEFLNEK